MNILITGIAGLIGSNFADWLIENTDYEIIGIDNLSGGLYENVNKKVKFYKLDLTKDFEIIENVIGKFNKIDIIYHFAAYAAEGLSPFIRKFNYTNNLIATTNLVSLAIKYNIKRFIFTSSMAVYGNNVAPFTEDLQPRPIDPYGIAKFSCEQDIRVAGEQHGLDYCIVRPHNVYGPKQIIWDKYRNVLGIWFLQYLRGKPITIFGSGTQTRMFTYIDDILKQLWSAGIDPRFSRLTVNIGANDQYYTIREAANYLFQAIGVKENIIYTDQRHEVKEATVSHNLIKSLLEDISETDLLSGLKKMWSWAKQQSLEVTLQFPDYELEKGIYTVWKI